MSELVWTPAEVAGQLGCCETIIDRLIDDGRIPHVRISARKTVIPKAALARWLDDEAHASTILAELEADARRGVA